MNDGGFLDTRRSNPVGLGLIVAGHAAVLTALALAPPEAVIPKFFQPLVIDSIADPAPPPPEMPPPLPKAEPRAQPASTDPIIKTASDGPVIELSPFPLPRSVPPVLPTIPDPVLTSATIDPAAMGRFQPDYPPALVRAEIEVSATVRLLVGSDGRVRAVEQVSATHPDFFEATRRQALRFWKFKAATRDGVAIESWRAMTVRFTIEN